MYKLLQKWLLNCQPVLRKQGRVLMRSTYHRASLLNDTERPDSPVGNNESLEPNQVESIARMPFV